MPSTNLQRSAYRAYPFLDHEEFAEACHYLDNKYCQARLGPLRRQWRLDVHTALNVAFGTGPAYATFVQITRSLEDVAGLGDLTSSLGGFSMAHTTEGDRCERDETDMVMDTEEDDPELLMKPPSPPDYGHVQYEIHLHPTYRAPCLWFSLHNLPAGELGLDVDTVFRRLVPDQYKDSLRRMGAVGGISADVSLGFLQVKLYIESTWRSWEPDFIGLPRQLTKVHSIIPSRGCLVFSFTRASWVRPWQTSTVPKKTI